MQNNCGLKDLIFVPFDLQSLLVTLPKTRIQTETCGSGMKFFLLQHSGTINDKWLAGSDN